MMNVKLRALSRYRPRVLAVALFLLVAAPIVLANLTFDAGTAGPFNYRSYGWPLIWRRAVEIYGGWTPSEMIGWYYSAVRLAANVAIWLVMLAGTAGACEWALRRYRPRLRWNLKALLAAVALAAVLCGWCVALRDRANIQDRLMESRSFGIRVERCGPMWLDLLGLDRFRRRIVSVHLTARELRAGSADEQRFLSRMAELAELPDLRCLSMEVDRLSPAMVATLNEMQTLRRLTLVRKGPGDGDDPPFSNAVLPRIGRMKQLSELELSGISLDDSSLAGLTNLKSLSVSSGLIADALSDEKQERLWQECLAAIGKRTHLEDLHLVVPLQGKSLAQLLGRLTNRA